MGNKSQVNLLQMHEVHACAAASIALPLQVMFALQTYAILLAFSACSIADKKTEGPVYLLEDSISLRLVETNRQYQEDNKLSPENPLQFSDEENFEWESYDGWFNNPAHPEWGGYGEHCSNWMGITSNS